MFNIKRWNEPSSCMYFIVTTTDNSIIPPFPPPKKKEETETEKKDRQKEDKVHITASLVSMVPGERRFLRLVD